jgi:hypothetical protein
MDVPFPQTLAIHLTKRIGKMVHKSREAGPTDRIVIDGTHIMFVVGGRNGTPLQARLASESEGRNSRALRKIKDLLREYCEAKAPDYSALANQIEAEVTLLTH